VTANLEERLERLLDLMEGPLFPHEVLLGQPERGVLLAGQRGFDAIYATNSTATALMLEYEAVDDNRLRLTFVLNNVRSRPVEVVLLRLEDRS
jgi:hypothetical protein